MFSRLLIKLIDEAILPAVFLLATRIVSVVIITKYHGFNFTINSSGIVFNTLEHYVVVNSASIMCMVGALSLGLVYIIIKSVVFHESHISPATSAKVFSLNLPHFIQSSYDLYSQGAVWLSYMYLLLIVSGIMAFFGLVYAYVFYAALGVTLISNAILILDIENEVKIGKGNSALLDTDETYLERDNE